MIIKYNLGCGTKKLKDFDYNLDKDDVDLNTDFVLKPKADFILLDNVLEHLNDPDNVMKNINKNLSDDGVVKVILPTFQPNIFHKNFVYDKDYLNNICNLKSSCSQNEYLFDKVDVKYCDFSFRRFVYLCYKLLMLLFFEHISFELKKR